MELFQVLDPVMPTGSVTAWEEGGCRGPGMFLVPGFFERWHDGDERFRKLFEIEYHRLLAEDVSRNGPLPER